MDRKAPKEWLQCLIEKDKKQEFRDILNRKNLDISFTVRQLVYEYIEKHRND